MADFKPINTKEEFDAAVAERIRVETAKYADYDALKEKAGKYDELLGKNLEQQVETLTRKLTAANETISGNAQTIAELTTRAEAAEGTVLRAKVAHANNLPYEMAARLNGSTEEELTADAKALAKFVVPPAPPAVAPLASTEPVGVTVNSTDAAFMQMASALGAN